MADESIIMFRPFDPITPVPHYRQHANWGEAPKGGMYTQRVDLQSFPDRHANNGGHATSGSFYEYTIINHQSSIANQKGVRC